MTLDIVQTTMHTPLGPLRLLATEQALRGIYFAGHKGAPECPAPSAALAHPVLSRAIEQLEEYFAGQRRAFDLPLDAQGTDFQKRVWSQLLDIDFGHTATYGQLAAKLQSPNAARAVGAANGRNPLSIVVPCHRVVGGNGKLTGYAGGLSAKDWLLRHELKNFWGSANFSCFRSLFSFDPRNQKKRDPRDDQQKDDLEETSNDGGDDDDRLPRAAVSQRFRSFAEGREPASPKPLSTG